jgi:hypothetical protein
MMIVNIWWESRRRGRQVMRLSQWRWLGLNLGLMVVVAGVALWPLWRGGAMEALTNRWGGTAVGADFSLIRRSADCRLLGGDTWWARLFCHRWLVYGREVLKHMSDHLNLDYLFLSGDENGRHSSSLFGVFYPWEILLMAGGVVWWWRQRGSKYARWLVVAGVGWWLVGVLPAGLTEATPHLLRSLSTAPLLIIIIVSGWQEVRAMTPARWWRVVSGVGVIGYVISVGIWMYHYGSYYRIAKSDWWQYGYQEAVETLARWQREYPELPVYMTRELGRPSIYYFWYNKIDPRLVQERHDQEKMDQGEFLTYTSDNISFGGGVTPGKKLVVLTPREEIAWRVARLEEASMAAGLEPRAEVRNLAGEVVLVVGKTYEYEQIEAEVDD